MTFWSTGQHGGEKRYNPWTYLVKPAVAKILEALHREGPLTVKQISESVGLSQTTVSRHVGDLIEIELLREVEVPEEERSYKVEKFYEPNFPIFSREDKERISQVKREVGERTAAVIIDNMDRLREVFESTSASSSGWSFEDLSIRHYMLQPSSHKVLAERGYLSDPPERPGGNWWWVYGEEKEVDT